jgi:hypothetical protein
LGQSGLTGQCGSSLAITPLVSSGLLESGVNNLNMHEKVEKRDSDRSETIKLAI